MEKKDRPFEEALYTKLYQLFSSIGIALNVPQLELLKDRSKEVAELISREATKRAIEMLNNIKQEVLGAVAEIEKKVNNINDNRVDIPIKNTDNLIENKENQ